MKIEQIEVNELIARRVPPGDNWILIDDSADTVHNSLTDALEAWFSMHGDKAEFRLAPLDSKLYAIRYEQKQIEQPKPKKFNLYGE
mgnify:FL=1|jgi:hypothetical protein|tara:strand:+ start:1648 stop:1905 length:258 start_codon:yes stop_codon:yes gene_type:complete